MVSPNDIEGSRNVVVRMVFVRIIGDLVFKDPSMGAARFAEECKNILEYIDKLSKARPTMVFSQLVVHVRDVFSLRPGLRNEEA